MKTYASMAVAVLMIACLTSRVQAQNTVYWDTNGSTPGAGIGFGDPNDGIWGTSDFWSTDPNGEVATTAWAPGDDAVFSAGNDAQDHFLEVSGTQLANSVLIEDGIVWFSSGTVDTGTGTVTIDPGAELRLFSSNRLNGGGKVVLNGGTLLSYSSETALNVFGLIPSTKGIEVDGIGSIGYDNFDGTPNNGVSIYSGVITGAGGAVDNGGAGTLVKVGPDQLGIGVTMVGTDRSTTLFTFAKLVVEEGSYRARHLDSVVDETVFGAVPLAELSDAITLNGGGIGSNATVTLHGFRGITVGPNGGFFDTGAGASINVPGPFSGSGTFSVTGTAGSGGFRLSHPNNVNTFSGNLIVDRGALFLDSSLTTPNFSGISPAAGVAGTVLVAANMVLTAGSDDQDSIYAGRISGAGSITKVGNGTLTLDSLAEWTNTGGVNIQGGTIKFGTSAAGFFTTTVVSIDDGATLDMNSINDTFGALSNSAGHSTGQVLQGISNITLGGGTSVGTQTFGGTITGTGNFTKGRTLPGGDGDTATQILTGDNSLGNVTVNSGALIFDGTNTTGSVTVNAGENSGILGGSGSVSGVVSVNAGATLAPGTDGPSVESFDVGGLVLETGSILEFELAAPGTSDLINVLDSNSLTLNGGSLNLTDTGGLAAGNYTLIDYAGTLGGSLANLALGTTPGGFTFGLVDSGSTIDLTVSGGSALIGDHNGDGFVNAADYVFWRDQMSDDIQGYNDWLANFGDSAGSGSAVGAAVPEPASLALAGLALAGLLSLRRRTR